MSKPSDILSEPQTRCLNQRQSTIYTNKLSRFAEYLATKGKEPKKENGYAEGTVNERVSRMHQIVKWIWGNEETTVEFTVEHGDLVNEALESDDFCKSNGEPYDGSSKRKFNDVLRNWFAFQGVSWSPEYTFSSQSSPNKPDPFHKDELKAIWEASLTYKSIRSYKNVSPEERDRLKAHIAQELGKPKDAVVPDDWEKLNYHWKIPSLVRTTRSHGWRPDLISRMSVDWYDPESQIIHIPEGKAPKNDAAWTVELTEEGALAIEKWLEQRSCINKYDGRDEMWLNREGNPYTSGNLNDLLDNLMAEAEIKERGRKLVWYSFRHSIGTYVYAEYKDLEIVAEQLRQKSREAASRYVHPLPEIKQEAAEIM